MELVEPSNINFVIKVTQNFKVACFFPSNISTSRTKCCPIPTYFQLSFHEIIISNHSNSMNICSESEVQTANGSTTADLHSKKCRQRDQSFPGQTLLNLQFRLLLNSLAYSIDIMNGIHFTCHWSLCTGCSGYSRVYVIFKTLSENVYFLFQL